MKKNKKTTLPLVEVGGELTVEPPKPEPNEYYIDLSRHIKVAKLLLVLLLVVFLLGMITVFRNDITVENYQYLIRFFTAADNGYTGDYQPIYYDSNGTTRLGIFHGDLAVIKRTGVNLYNMRGSSTMDYTLSYASPALITNGKYMLTYDIGGNTFDLFNNFSRLSGESYDYPIATAAVSPEGMYAVVTKSKEYQSVVNLYDHNFTLLSRISKDKYVMNVSIADDASEILIVSVYTENGAYNTEIMTYQPYNDTAKGSNIRAGAMGVLAGYHSDGSYTVLCSDSLLFFDRDDNQVQTFELGGITPSKCIISDKYTVLTYNKNIVGSSTAVRVFAPDGSELVNTAVDDKVIDVACTDKMIYLLCNEKLVRLSPDDGALTECNLDAGGSSLFAADEDTLLIGYSNMVKACAVKDLFDGEKKPAETSAETDDTAAVTAQDTSDGTSGTGSPPDTAAEPAA